MFELRRDHKISHSCIKLAKSVTNSDRSRVTGETGTESISDPIRCHGNRGTHQINTQVSTLRAATNAGD